MVCIYSPTSRNLLLPASFFQLKTNIPDPRFTLKLNQCCCIIRKRLIIIFAYIGLGSLGIQNFKDRAFTSFVAVGNSFQNTLCF